MSNMDSRATEPHTQESTASILVNNVINVLNKAKVSSNELETAIKPFAVIQWTKPIITKIGIQKTNRILGRLKRSSDPKDALELVIDHLHTALTDNGNEVPNRFSERISILAKYSLNRLAEFHTWIPALTWLAARNVDAPYDTF